MTSSILRIGLLCVKGTVGTRHISGEMKPAPREEVGGGREEGVEVREEEGRKRRCAIGKPSPTKLTASRGEATREDRVGASEEEEGGPVRRVSIEVPNIATGSIEGAIFVQGDYASRVPVELVMTREEATAARTVSATIGSSTAIYVLSLVSWRVSKQFLTGTNCSFGCSTSLSYWMLSPF